MVVLNIGLLRGQKCLFDIMRSQFLPDSCPLYRDITVTEEEEGEEGEPN